MFATSERGTVVYSSTIGNDDVMDAAFDAALETFKGAGFPVPSCGWIGVFYQLVAERSVPNCWPLCMGRAPRRDVLPQTGRSNACSVTGLYAVVGVRAVCASTGRSNPPPIAHHAVVGSTSSVESALQASSALIDSTTGPSTKVVGSTTDTGTRSLPRKNLRLDLCSVHD